MSSLTASKSSHALRLACAASGLASYGAAYFVFINFGSRAGDYLAISGSCLLIAAGLLTLALRPGRSQSAIIAVAFVESWTLAAIAGWLYAGCDLGMRPSTLYMAVGWFPLALLAPPVGAAWVGIGIAVAWIVEAIDRKRRITASWTLSVALVCAILIVAIGVRFAVVSIAGASGVRPTPGACVV